MNKMEKNDCNHSVEKDARTAIVLVTKGTTQEGTKELIHKYKAAINSKYPDAVIRTAIESEVVRKKLAEKGVIESSPLGSVANLIDEGFSKIIMQPMWITGDHTYHNLYSIASAINSLAGKHGHLNIQGVLIGKSLCTNMTQCSELADVITSVFGKINNDEALVLLASGEMGSDAVLCQLQFILDKISQGRIIVGNSTGYPNIEWVNDRLAHINAKKVMLTPFDLIPGKHFKYAAEINDDSWKKQLESNGYEVSISEKIIADSDQMVNLIVKIIDDVGKGHQFL